MHATLHQLLILRDQVSPDSEIRRSRADIARNAETNSNACESGGDDVQPAALGCTGSMVPCAARLVGGANARFVCTGAPTGLDAARVKARRRLLQAVALTGSSGRSARRSNTVRDRIAMVQRSISAAGAARPYSRRSRSPMPYWQAWKLKCRSRSPVTQKAHDQRRNSFQRESRHRHTVRSSPNRAALKIC